MCFFQRFKKKMVVIYNIKRKVASNYGYGLNINNELDFLDVYSQKLKPYLLKVDSLTYS